MDLPQSGGKWDTPDGKPPIDGSGRFTFDDPKTLPKPDGRTVTHIDFKDGEPDFSAYAYGNKKYNLWEVTGDVRKDEAALRGQLGDIFDPPDTSNSPDGYVFHHASDGSVMYVPRVLHDKGRLGGVAHTGGNSILNNDPY